MQFYIIDAFTEQVFGGNPAGVVILPRGGGFPDDKTMQQTAAELRYSETAFILQKSDKVFQIRYFTPDSEVELCGHATIASFIALQDAGLVSRNGAYVNETLAGTLEIHVEEGFVLMDMAEPVALREIQDPKELEEIYRVMGVPASQGVASVGRDWTLFPEVISTGLPDLILPVVDPLVLADLNPDFPAMSALSEKYGVIGVHAFALGEGGETTAYCRNFAPLVGIDEEAATGTANGALTYYLYKNALIEDGANCLFLQGESMDRPSKIMSRITELEESRVKVQIGGNGAILAKGDIQI